MEHFLQEHENTKPRLEGVADLIEGFETPYGMELLASVHWVSVHDPSPAVSADEAVIKVHRWNIGLHLF